MSGGYLPVAGRRGPRITVVVVVGALVLAGAVWAGWAWGRTGRDAGPVAAPSVYTVVAHGPAEIVSGVPAGYTHDVLGAASAAAGFVQTLYNIGSRAADPSRAKQLLSAKASAAAVEELAGARPEPNTVYVKAPLAFSEKAYSDTAAGIGIWECGASVDQPDPAAAQVGVADCGTWTVSLVWEAGDWKVVDVSWANGPGFGSFTTLLNSGGWKPIPGGALMVLLG